MIVRISTEGQYDLGDEVADELNRLDNQAVAAVDAGDVAGFEEVFEAMLALVRSGRALGDDVLEESDVILPPPDTSFDEARTEFTGEGLIPGGSASTADDPRAVEEASKTGRVQEARSWLPGYAADTTAGEDLLGIRNRVDLLSSVLAAKRLETPLAIGIFGDWGSGKSFFMRQVQQGIALLVEHSARAAALGSETYYCSHIRQVTFNAWLYSDSDMWPSLAAQVFRSVSGEEPEAPHGAIQERALGEFQDQAARRYRQLTEDRHVVDLEAVALDQRIEETSKEIAGKRAEMVETTEHWSTEAGAVARTAVAAQRATEIRMRFEEFSALITENLAAQEAGEQPPDDVPPIERVVVYVDDLDRCQPAVVVNVLEAIKLLLALPHFVVLVGVDSRWLFRSLEQHFRHMMREPDEPDGLAGDPGSTTPQSYLEKIFQYSLVIPPMTSAGFRRLVEQMLPVEPGANPGGTQLSPPTSAARTGDGIRRQSAALEPDLTPGDLLIGQQELAFILRLAPMFETPRATKRLTNLYRLIRVAVGAERLLDDDAYQPMLTLLSVSLAYPTHAGRLFTALAFAHGATLDEVLTDITSRSPELPGWSPVIRELTAVIEESRADRWSLGERPATDFAAWVPVVAEFSFHPWRELLPQ